MPLTPGPPGPPGLGGRRCSTHIPIASPSSFQSCQVELAKKGGQKRGHAVFFLKKLDDGWPESVEEQGLLLLVWRRNIRNGIWKLCYRQSRRKVSRQNSEKCKTIVCIANTFTHRRFYTDAFTHKAFTHRSFYTQKLLQTEAFTHRSFYIQKLLHTDASTQTLLHTEAFTHRHFYTQTLLHTGAAFTHKRLYTQKLLHIDAIVCIANTFTHRRFYTQKLLHTEAFTQTLLHAKLLHTEAFTHRSFYTQKLLHTDASTQTLLHTEAFTHRHFLHTDPFTHRSCFYTQPPKSPKTSTTATKRSSGNAYTHVCSDSSGGSRVFSC